MQDLSLAKLDEVLLAIEAATTVQEIKSTIDAAIAIGVYTKQAKMGKNIELRAVEYILRAERKLGEMLVEAKATGQIKEGNASGNNQYKSGTIPNPNSSTFTLKEAGIDPKLSSKAQKIAAVPKEDFEKKITEGKESGKLSDKTVIKPAQFAGDKSSLIAQILAVMKDGQWRTLKEIESLTGGERRDTARLLRFLRDPEFGSYIVELRSEGSEKEYKVLGKQNYNGIEPKPDVHQPTISREMLSLTAQQKFDLAVKQEKHRLGIQFQDLVQKEVNRRMKLLLETITPQLLKREEEAQRIIKARRGIMTKKAYNKIWSCLHPDRAMQPQRNTDEELRQVYEGAFDIFSKLKRLVLNEEHCPTPVDDKSAPIPKTPEEWEEAERKATAERKAKYAASRANKNKSVSPA